MSIFLRRQAWLLFLALACATTDSLVAPPRVLRAADDEGIEVREERAFRAAVAKVAPAVVRIETLGASENVGSVLAAMGPTTGLVVSADGDIITSSFNFAQKPASILVTLADGSRVAAKLIATDHSRQLVLLKVATDKTLTTVEAAPQKEVQVGQWAVAIGRTYETNKPNLSVGIVSAVNRIWGKAVQTDAKISPANYGGPLIDIRGRVLGLLTPLSTEGGDEGAGVEWYDSGIGFAVPLQQILNVLPKLKEGKNQFPGLLGVSLREADFYAEPAVIAACQPKSPAQQAGFKAGDQIVEVDGQAVASQAQLKHQSSHRYAGEKINVVVLRGKQRIAKDLELVAKLPAYQHPLLGILPLRDATSDQTEEKSNDEASEKASDESSHKSAEKSNDGEPPLDPNEKGESDKNAAEKNTDDKKTTVTASVGVRYVYPGSPADKAGVKPGDRLIACEGKKIVSAQSLREQIANFSPGQSIKIEFTHDGQTQTADVQLGTLPENIPLELPAAHAAMAKPAGLKTPVGKVPVKLPEFPNACVAYVPENYSPRVPYGLVVWLHAPNSYKEQEIIDRWKDVCARHDLILLAPASGDPAKWQRTEAEFIRKAMDDVILRYNVDRARVVVAGQEGGGTLALLLAFTQRDLVRGVISVDGGLTARAKPPANDPVNRLAIVMAASKKASVLNSLDTLIKSLRELKYPVTRLELGETPRAMSAAELTDIGRWIDSLDRI